MKKISLLILLSLMVVGLTLSGCNVISNLINSITGGGQQPVGPVGPTMPGNSITEGGFLSGPGASYTFAVNAGNVEYVEVPFTFPRGQGKFFVKVVGQDGYSVLGDFDLDQGEVIQLSGGGTFYLTIRSESGSGNWNATYSLTQ